MRLLPAIFLAAVGLSACTSKVSEVCGGTGSCCTLAFTNNTEGNPVYNYHQCVPQAGPCPPESVDEGLVVDRIFPNDAPEEGKCGAEWETVWIWEGDFWRSSSSSSEVAALRSQLADTDVAALLASTDLPPLPPKTDKNYCLAACQRAEETGGLGLCPSGDVPNDVSVGLLRLIAKYAQIETIPNGVRSLESVFDDFQVSVDDNACSRGDLVISDERISNTGEMCETRVSFKSGPNKVFLTATMSLPTSVLSDVSEGDGFAIFPQSTMSYDIRFDDPFLQNGYGGTFSVVTEKDGISIVATTSANSISPCVKVQPSVNDEADILVAYAESLAANPSALNEIVTKLRSFAGEAEEYAIAEGIEDAPLAETAFSDFSNPFPLSAELQRMTALLSTTARDGSVTEFLASSALQSPDLSSMRYSDVVTLFDMAYCNSELEADLIDVELARYYPKTDGFSANLEEMRFRDTQAAKLLLCTRVFETLAPTTRTVLQEAARSFLQ